VDVCQSSNSITVSRGFLEQETLIAEYWMVPGTKSSELNMIKLLLL